MAKCETTHWELDCGAGHGCGLVEDSDTGELLGWFCSSTLVIGKKKPRDKQATLIDSSTKIEFCCNEVSLSALAEAFDHFIVGELTVPKGKHGNRISLCTKGTVNEVMRSVGLTMRA